MGCSLFEALIFRALFVVVEVWDEEQPYRGGRDCTVLYEHRR